MDYPLLKTVLDNLENIKFSSEGYMAQVYAMDQYQ